MQGNNVIILYSLHPCFYNIVNMTLECYKSALKVDEKLKNQKQIPHFYLLVCTYPFLTTEILHQMYFDSVKCVIISVPLFFRCHQSGVL